MECWKMDHSSVIFPARNLHSVRRCSSHVWWNQRVYQVISIISHCESQSWITIKSLLRVKTPWKSPSNLPENPMKSHENPPFSRGFSIPLGKVPGPRSHDPSTARVPLSGHPRADRSLQLVRFGADYLWRLGGDVSHGDLLRFSGGKMRKGEKFDDFYMKF